MWPLSSEELRRIYVEGRPVKATNKGQPWKEADQLSSTDFFQRIHHYFNEIGASARMRQEFEEYHAGKQAKKQEKLNIQIMRITWITGLGSSSRNELGMQDGMTAGRKQPAVHPIDGTRKGRAPTRLEATLPPQSAILCCVEKKKKEKRKKKIGQGT